MKRTRKGFTLLELLVVIGVMGLLSSLAMVGGQEATNAARATNIADNLEKAASAMMMYYADNSEAINASGATVDDIATGASAYLKTALAKVETGDNTYFPAVSAASTAGAKWYIGYKFQETDSALKAIIANKATRMGLYSTKTGTSDTKYASGADGYPDIVYMLVR